MSCPFRWLRRRWFGVSASARGAPEVRLDDEHRRAARGDGVAGDEIALLDHLIVVGGHPLTGEGLEPLEGGRCRLSNGGRRGRRGHAGPCRQDENSEGGDSLCISKHFRLLIYI